MAKSLNCSRKFIASHFVTSYKSRNFAAVKRPKHLLRLLLALLPLAAASSVVAGPPAPPPPGVPFRYITLRLANGAALDAGKLGELHLEADALITIGTDDKRLQVPLDQVLGWDIRAEENFTTSATAVGPDRITFRVFPGVVAVEGLDDTDRVTHRRRGQDPQVPRAMTRRFLSLLTVVAIAVAAYAAAPRWLDIIFRQPDSVSYIVRTIPADSIASAEHIPGEATQYDTLLVTTKAGTRHGFALDSMARCELRPHVPVIYINTDEPAYDIVDKVNYLSAKLSMSAGAGVDAEFDSLPPTTMKVRGRGNTTLNFPKKPYRLKFDKKISLCGLKKAKNYALIANYIDVTLMHNTCAFAIAERMGLPYTNHSIAVDVVFNGRYCGSYMLTEKIGINAGSVDIDEEKGLLLELDDHMDEDFCYWSPGLGIPVMVKDPDLTELAEADTTLSATERFDSIKAEFNAAER